MAKNIMALLCLITIFVSTACQFNSDKPAISAKEKIVKSRTSLFIETYPVAESEMAASPYLTRPAHKTASSK